MKGAIYMSAAFIVAAVLSAVYLFFFIQRMLATFGADTKKIGVRIISGIAAAALGALTSNMFSFAGVAILHIVVMALFADLVNLIIKLLAKNKHCLLGIWKRVYGSGALALAFTVALMIFGYINLHNVTETRYTVNTEKEIRPEGYRVALISDVHFGVSIDYNELLRVCDEISEKDVDIVVLCGDIVDNNSTREEMYQVFSAFGKIKSEFGIFYVHGNHDRPYGFRGFESEFSEQELIAAIEDNRITILQDEIYELAEDFVLVGREDRSVRSRRTTSSLLSGTDTDKFILTLDHQPQEYAATAASGTDLVLSGHTHGGQIWPLKQVQEIFKFNDKVYGHGFIDGDTQYIVTSGLAGWKYPIKTASPAEYVIVDIKG